MMERWQQQEVQVKESRWAEEIPQIGIEHRLWKEEKEEQSNTEAKEGWRFAADAVRIADERAGSEDQKHTSEGVLLQSTATWEQLLERKKEQ